MDERDYIMMNEANSSEEVVGVTFAKRFGAWVLQNEFVFDESNGKYYRDIEDEITPEILKYYTIEEIWELYRDNAWK